MKKPFLMLSLLLLSSAATFAQTPNLGIETATQSLWDEVRKSAPMIFAIIFLISALANSGKLMGESNRDYVGFFRGVAIWIGAMTLIGGIITFILSLSF